MKMKKLTALALAGVLCMGMSATAFAAGSVTPATTKQTITDLTTGEEKEEEISLITVDVDDTGNALTYKNKWSSDAKSIEANLKELAEIAGMDVPFDNGAAYGLMDFANYTLPEGVDKPTTEKPVTLRFSVSQYKDNILQAKENGATPYVYVAHWVAAENPTEAVPGKWEITREEIKGTAPNYYIERAFTSLSPIALIYSVTPAPNGGSGNGTGNGDGDGNGDGNLGNNGAGNGNLGNNGAGNGNLGNNGAGNGDLGNKGPVTVTVQQSKGKVVGVNKNVSPKTGE